MHNFYRDKSSTIICAISAIFKYAKLPEVNSRPIGENSPNLATLLERHKTKKKHFRQSIEK
jgi:hypothetical protein